MLPWLIIPVKSLLHGKSRLAGVLSVSRRRQLNELLLRRVLATAARFPGRRRTVVVSACARALAVAEQCGVMVLREPRRRGLNAAANWALECVRARGAATVLLVACDLPRLRPHDLRELVRAGAPLPTGVLLCPDERCSGTNALLLGPGAQLRFRFGAASLGKHLREARALGLPVRVHSNERIAADIDTPLQLRRWQSETGISDEHGQRRRLRPRGSRKKSRRTATRTAA